MPGRKGVTLVTEREFELIKFLVDKDMSTHEITKATGRTHNVIKIVRLEEVNTFEDYRRVQAQLWSERKKKAISEPIVGPSMPDDYPTKHPLQYDPRARNDARFIQTMAEVKHALDRNTASLEKFMEVLLSDKKGWKRFSKLAKEGK